MYNKLFTKILDSSIWLESTPTRIVWITFLAMMDQDGTVALSSIGNVSNRARVTEQEATEAINCLESPDHFNPDQDNEGRRIERIPGMGWFVLNAAKYRDIIKAETARAANRERVQRHRAKSNGGVMGGNETVMPSDAGASSPPSREGGSETEKPEQNLPPPGPETMSGRPRSLRGIPATPSAQLLDTWLEAVAQEVGAKSSRTMANAKGWSNACSAAITEGFTLAQFLAAVRSERERNRETPQFFSPNGVLKLLQSETAKPARKKFIH